jgi:ABC-type multidrug transport system fused ATPase/permease subunit
MDDPFSALDAHVGSHVCSSIQKYIKDCKVKTAIIVTNQVHFLPYADKVLMMHNGTIVEQGQYKELRANGGKFAELVRNQTIDSSATLVIPSGPVFLSAPSRRKISIVEPKEREMPIVRRGAASIITPTTEPNPTQSNSAPTPDIEEKESGNIGFSVYWYYIVSGGGILFGLGLFVIALVIASRVFSSLWLADWSDADTAMKYAFPVWLGVYVSLVLFESIMVLVRATLTVFWSRNASIRLHYDVLSSVTRATTNFFDMTPTGRLLTRLFKDMGLIDSALAYQFVRVQFN